MNAPHFRLRYKRIRPAVLVIDRRPFRAGLRREICTCMNIDRALVCVNLESFECRGAHLNPDSCFADVRKQAVRSLDLCVPGGNKMAGSHTTDISRDDASEHSSETSTETTSLSWRQRVAAKESTESLSPLAVQCVLGNAHQVSSLIKRGTSEELNQRDPDYSRTPLMCASADFDLATSGPSPAFPILAPFQRLCSSY